jgi:hypothetical protein
MGYELLATGNHPLIDVDGKECFAGDSLGKTVQLQIPKTSEEIYRAEWRDGPVHSSVEITEDFAKLIGLFMGDGSMWASKKGVGMSGAQLSIACTGKDTDVRDEIVRLISSVFGVTPQIRQPSPGGFEVRATSRLIYDTFKRLGFLRNDTGKTMRKVCVPDCIWRSPLRVTSQFLSGLFEADGFNAYGTPRTCMFSKYPEFIADVQLLLLSHGVTSRAAKMFKKNGSGKMYLGNELQLRKNESIAFNEKIGFISKRKRENFSVNTKKRKGGAPEIPMLLVDRIASVEEDKTDEVFNLSIDSEQHWFDANGFLTHNTEDDAFLMTGQTFVRARTMAKIVALLTKNPPPFQGYAYEFGETFMETRCNQVRTADEAQLKIYEQPSSIGVYVMGVDPAYGRSENQDRSVVQVFRCYADKLVQVAEFASSDPESFQCAWVMAHLAGLYRNIMIIIEISGPGEVTVQELKHLRQLFDAGALPNPGGGDVTDIFGNARYYMYHRSDSPGPGFQYNWKSSLDNKLSILNGLRDSLTVNLIEIRSIACALEIQGLVQDGFNIEPAISTNKDDRVFGLAFAHRAWVDWVRPSQVANNETWAASVKQEAAIADGSNTTMVSHIVSEFFSLQQMSREEQAIRAAAGDDDDDFDDWEDDNDDD